MQYGIFSRNRWLFPDSEPTEGKRDVALTLLRGQTGAFQVIVDGLTVGDELAWQSEGLSGLTLCFYREKDVCVNRNTNDLQNGALTTDRWEEICDQRVRQAPYRVYDALLPVADLRAEKVREVFYVTAVPTAQAPAGQMHGRVMLLNGTRKLSIPLCITVAAKSLPASTLNLTNWFNIANMASRHGLEYGSDAHVETVKRYFSLLRECHNNVFWCTLEDMTVEKTEDGYRFDFSNAAKWAQLALDYGAERLEWSPQISRPCWADPPFLIYDKTKKATVNVLSTKGRKYLTAFLTQFNDFLTGKGWREISLVHVSDEPKENCASDFRILCGIYRKYLPGIKLIDATEIYFIEEALDIYVPKNHYYQLNKNDFEALRDDRNELWFYTCNMPGGAWLNRHLDAPLLNTRLLHWGNYRYHLTGYLHWGFNQLRNGQDPFEETSGGEGLPAGDTHIVYPFKEEPLRSLRFVQMLSGIEDYEILNAIAQKDKTLADSLCKRGMRSFVEYITDVDAFDALEQELVSAYDAL